MSEPPFPSESPKDPSSSDLGPPPLLQPCPFCGKALTLTWRKTNPKARCSTQDCWGGKLPVLPLDHPESVASWNSRPNANSSRSAPNGESQ